MEHLQGSLRRRGQQLGGQLSSFSDQLPRLSAYDPGATGEGGLDPLGLGSIADRIADVLVPGLRARMSQPRFVTLSAIGAFAYQTLHDLTADEGKTTADIAFEWIVVEALVRNPGDGRADGVPGKQKAQRAKAAGERLSRRTYLSGPRVFGFTGVYRPFSRDADVLTLDGRPGPSADRLVEAWERDYNLDGFAAGNSRTVGGRLRIEITKACKETLRKGECAIAPNSKLLHKLSEILAPQQAKDGERSILRSLITSGEHEIRNELTSLLVRNLPPPTVSQGDLTRQLIPGVSPATQNALQAALDFEEAATALDNCFRSFLAHATNQHGAVISPADAAKAPGLASLAGKIEGLVGRAIDSVDKLGDGGLTLDTCNALSSFKDRFTPVQFFERLIARHYAVQSAKQKLAWLEQIAGDWMVRTPYRNNEANLDSAIWIHPMRVVTLANFLRCTA